MQALCLTLEIVYLNQVEFQMKIKIISVFAKMNSYKSSKFTFFLISQKRIQLSLK